MYSKTMTKKKSKKEQQTEEKQPTPPEISNEMIEEMAREVIVSYVSETLDDFNSHTFTQSRDMAQKTKLNASLIELQTHLELVRQAVYDIVSTGLRSSKFSLNPDPEQAAQESYAYVKHELQNAIADGFEGAFMSFSGQEAGFYCKVTPAGPAINNLEI